MRRTKLKLNLISLSSFCAYESWLSDMAKKGLILKRCGYLFTRFFVTEQKDIEYRLQFIGNSVSEATKDTYQKSGWTYVNTVGEYSVFYHDTNQNTTSADEEIIKAGMNFNYINRNFTLLYASLIILAFTLFWFLYSTIFSGPFPVLNTASNFESLLFFISGVLTLVIIVLRRTYEFRKLRQAYYEGRQFNHHMHWKSYYQSAFTVIAVLLVLLLINIGTDVYSSNNTIRIHNGQIPETVSSEVETVLLHLSEIEGVPQAENDANEIENLYFLKKPSILFTEYLLSELYAVESEPNSASKAVNSSYLEEVYIKLNLALLAKPILKDFVDNALNTYESHPDYASEAVMLTTLDDDRFDEAYYIKTNNSLDIFVRKDRAVIKLHYLGSKGIEDILPILNTHFNENK